MARREFAEEAANDAEIEYDFGPCCACGATGKGVRTIITLDVRARTAGFGWGCVECGLGPEGAVAVVCDGCFEAGHPILYACDGPPREGIRIPIEELTEPFDHDFSKLPGLLLETSAADVSGAAPNSSAEAGASGKRTCKICGCTEDRACITSEGPCHWTAEDLCSACNPREINLHPSAGELLLPFEPEDIGSLRRRFRDALVGVFEPDEITAGRQEKAGNLRRHTFDFSDGIRLIVSIDGGPWVGPKLHVSLWHMAALGSGRTQPLRTSEPLSAMRSRLRRLRAGIEGDPFIVFAEGPKGSRLPYAVHAFFWYTAIPQSN